MESILTIIFRPVFITFTSSRSSIRVLKVLTVTTYHNLRNFNAIRGNLRIGLQINSTIIRIHTSLFRELIINIFRDGRRVISTILHNISSFNTAVMYLISDKTNSRHSFQLFTTMALVSMIGRHNSKHMIVHMVGGNSNIQPHILRVLRASNSTCQLRLARHTLNLYKARVRANHANSHSNHHHIHVIRVTIRYRTRLTSQNTISSSKRTTIVIVHQHNRSIYHKVTTGHRHNSKGTNVAYILPSRINTHTVNARCRNATILSSLALTIRVVLRYQVLSQTSVIQTSIRRHNRIRYRARRTIRLMNLQKSLRSRVFRTIVGNLTRRTRHVRKFQHNRVKFRMNITIGAVIRKKGRHTLTTKATVRRHLHRVNNDNLTFNTNSTSRLRLILQAAVRFDQ